MKKNVAGQVVLAQLVSKTDGSDCTSGATTVSVTGDAGTRAIGSVGAGAATHEGGGLWSYTPTQAETNFENVCFQFVNASAVTANIQIYPTMGDAAWDAIIEGTYTAGDLLRVLAGVAAGKTNIVKLSNGATVTFRDISDSSQIIEATMQKSNRVTVTITP